MGFFNQSFDVCLGTEIPFSQRPIIAKS